MKKMIIDCLRQRYICPWSATRYCPPPRKPCDPCDTLSCEEELAEAREALRAFSLGKREVEISEDGTRVRYDNSKEGLQCLKDRIRDLNYKCGEREQTGTVAYCDPCGNTGYEETFVRTRPAAISYSTSEYDY